MKLKLYVFWDMPERFSEFSMRHADRLNSISFGTVIIFNDTSTVSKLILSNSVEIISNFLNYFRNNPYASLPNVTLDLNVPRETPFGDISANNIKPIASIFLDTLQEGD